MLEEFIEEEVHMFTWNYRGKETENPLTCVHLGTYVMFNEMTLQFGQVALD